MKLTSKVLIAMLLFAFGGLFISNSILKSEFEKVDKTDMYWTYGKILEQPFSHIKIDGGNITNIAFEQSPVASIKVLKDWHGYAEGTVKAMVKGDTLFIKFPNTYRDIFEKNWMARNTLVRVFSPNLFSFTGVDTKFEMYKTKQKSIAINLSGKSSFEMESMIPELDSIYVSAKDSSAVIFEMSPEYRASESFHAKYVNADIKDASLLDIGHGQVDSLQITISDTSGVFLSGGTLRKKYH